MVLVLDRIRYALGVLALVSYVPGLIFWFVIHPFVRVWRRLGPVAAYACAGVVHAALAIAAYRARGFLLGRDFGTNWAGIVTGGGVIATLAWLGFTASRPMDHLSVSTRMGIPELSNVGRPEALVCTGIYRVVRHPIYASAAAAGVGYALIVNHLGIYVLFVGAIPVLYLVTVLEERELINRFGDAYRRYQREVPRMLPWRRKD
jgi:protein-S-isoprenylcysteine O-methyltransferase Ste14